LAKARAGHGAHFEFQHRLASGEIREVEVYSGPVSVGERVLLHSIVHDISERKRSSLALLASEELNRRILEAVPGGIVQVGLDGSIRAANSAAQRILGLNWDALKSRFVSDWLPETINEDGSPCAPDDYPVVHCLKTGQAQPPKTIGVRQQDGRIHWAVFTAVPLNDPITGAVAGSVVTFLDVTGRIKADEALRASEARFRALVEEATEAICIADSAGRGIEANSRACEMFGYTREEFSRLSVADTVPPQDRALIGPRFGEMKKGHPQRWERELVRKDGSRFPVEISARFLPDGRLMAIMRDMTERKRAEEALRESELRFRQLADAAPVFIWLANASGRRTYFSRGWVEFTGRALDDEMNDGWLDGVHAEDSQRVSDMLADALLARQDFSLEYRLRASDGEYRWVLDHGVARFSERGEFAGYIGSSLDITERKRAEDALRISERQYRELMEQSGDGIFIFNEKARVTDVNSRFCELLGYTKSEMLTMDPSKLVDPSAHGRFQLRFEQMNSGETLRLETEMIHKDGKRVPLDVSARRVGQGRYQAVFRDMTERKRAETELRESQRRLTTLLSNRPGMAYRCKNDREWTMVFASEGAVSLSGYALEELLSGKVSYGSQIIHKDDQQRIWDEVQRALAERRGFTLSYRIVRKDGVERWVWEQGRGIYSESGELVALEGFITDVTERRQAEEALRQSQQRDQAFIAQSTEGVWRFEFRQPVDLSLDIETQVDLALYGGVLSECNDEMAKMYGYSRAEEIIGVRIAQLLDMSD
ncbi:hypothetical protein BAC2_03469, partial [uncultured bacterium]